MSAAGLDFHPVAKYHPTEPKGLFKLPVHYVQNIQYTVDVKVFKTGKKKKKVSLAYTQDLILLFLKLHQ